MSKYSINMKKIQWEEIPRGTVYKYVKQINCGNVIDTIEMSNVPRSHIKHLPGRKYQVGYYKSDKTFVPKSDKIYDFKAERRVGEDMRNQRSLKIIFKKMSQYIATNFQGAENEKFYTLTYAEQTNDHVQMHDDFRKFWQRLQRAYPKLDLAYINIVEPHETGNWHMHLLLKSMSLKSFFLDVLDVQRIWGLGNVHYETIKSDHIGAYFVAYFTNMEVYDEDVELYSKHFEIAEKNGKKYIKGLRLKFYPDNMIIMRYSKNIKKPKKTANKRIPKGFKRTYQDITHITDEENERTNAITKVEQYKRKNIEN